MPLPRVPPFWTRLSFSVKFAAIIAVAGVLIAVIPLSLASGQNRNQAAQRAIDKAGVVVNLIAGQQKSLASFASGMAQELAAPLSAGESASVQSSLRRYSQVNTAADVVGVSGPLANVAIRAGSQLSIADPLVRALGGSLTTAETVVAAHDGTPWLIASSTVTATQEHVYIARPVDATFLTALDGTITTPADPAGIAVVRANHVASVGSRVLDQPVVAGSAVSTGIAGVLGPDRSARVVDVGGREAGAYSRPLGAGFLVLVSTPVSAVNTLWQPIAILLGLIVVAMACIVLVVQTDLQRPLRRLDRAVAALAADDYDVPVPQVSNAEIGRLSSSFEEMRTQLRATVRATRARALVAGALNSPQPIEKALREVCVQMRASAAADSAFILVNGSEMGDSFAVSEGLGIDGDVTALLGEEGPIGSAYRHRGPDAILVGAAPDSSEAGDGLREFCTAPLRMGRGVLGVIGVARVDGGFAGSDASLVSSSAEQVALALERYRLIAVVQRQASIDDLTGLYNHRFLVDYLGQQVALAERLNRPLALLIIDLDHFKRVNDTYGHPVGDVVLSAFAQTLSHSIRRADLAARYGGEEFVVVMSDTAAGEARIVAEKIRRAAESVAVAVDGGSNRVSVSVSIGGAAYPQDTTTAAELLATADAALYDAKHAGRNRVCMAGDGDDVEGPSNVTVIRPRRSAQ